MYEVFYTRHLSNVLTFSNVFILYVCICTPYDRVRVHFKPPARGYWKRLGTWSRGFWTFKSSLNVTQRYNTYFTVTRVVGVSVLIFVLCICSMRTARSRNVSGDVRLSRCILQYVSIIHTFRVYNSLVYVRVVAYYIILPEAYKKIWRIWRRAPHCITHRARVVAAVSVAHTRQNPKRKTNQSLVYRGRDFFFFFFLSISACTYTPELWPTVSLPPPTHSIPVE